MRDGHNTNNNNNNNEHQKEPGSSKTFDGPKWLLGKPRLLVYEKEYSNAEGKVDDDTIRSDLVDAYTNVPARLFSLRGEGYLSAHQTNNVSLKVPSESAAFSCVGLNVFQSKTDLTHVASKVASLKKYLKDMESFDAGCSYLEGDAPKYLIVCWNFSNFWKTEFTSCVHIFRRSIKIDSSGTGDCPSLDRAFSRFLLLPDEKKNEKLKYACKMKEVSEQLRSKIDKLGGERPVLIGKRLTTTYHSGPDYLEVDMDVGSSYIAAMLNGVVLNAAGNIVIDECFCIEAQQEDELPERALGVIRWNHCNLSECAHKLDSSGNIIP